MRIFSLLILLAACDQPSDGLRETPAGTGPVVLVDWDAKPLPDIPFPNDLATRPDPSSVTGLRVNISEEAPTMVETEARQKLNELMGFGVYAPITVAFEAPLDLDNIVARHPNDNDQSDDAFYIIDVSPDSPTYLQAVELDIGHGRYPGDLEEPNRYFPNDLMSAEPSLMFDTRNEDLNDNGVMDPGEDTDGDGYLDVPNVYPEGGDPIEDLLTWYERVTNTLIIRPVVPLREETTYAVVLTDRLLGLDGAPIRSPWEWVNHTRQTEALLPIQDALPEFGLSVDNVAYAWSFTTGRVTGDLVDIRRGLDGEGPWPFLQEDYPGGVTEALQMHALLNVPDIFNLPMSRILSVLITLDLFPEESASTLEATYGTFTDRVVGGSFDTINLMVDRDDGGYDISDEWWQVDPVAGTMSHEALRIAFTCILPKEADGHKQPFPMALFGHGYKSSRFDMFGFAASLNQAGVAGCAIDYPGHGPSVSDSQNEQINELLKPMGLYPFYEHLMDARDRDLDNDGRRDSGADMWISDPFHTRDMVRQAVVDGMMFTRAMKHCGLGEMKMDRDNVVACDWDQNGVPDIGGPDVDMFAAGGSLGGINTALLAAVEPDMTASVSIVPGGGLMDVASRSPLPGVVEAVHGRLQSPLLLGFASEGDLVIEQWVNSTTHMSQLHVATLLDAPLDGRVELENLSNGEIRSVPLQIDGNFRITVPADALDFFEKRVVAGMPLDGPAAGEIFDVADTTVLGDLLVLRIYNGENELVAEYDTWSEEVTHEAVRMPAGSPLIAASHGLGHIRATPEYRRLIMVTAMAMEPGDPVTYAHAYNLEPFEALGGNPVNTIVMPTPGDMIVAINGGIALARAAGFIDRHTIDERYGMTQDAWLIDRQVVRGIEGYGPYTNSSGTPVLFDADDLDNGTDELEAPSDAPLRATVATSVGVSGLRLPYVKTSGTHGFSLPNPSLPFDINSFGINQIARYFQTQGQELNDDPCLATWSCDFIREME
jgi:hypothetical protein